MRCDAVPGVVEKTGGASPAPLGVARALTCHPRPVTLEGAASSARALDILVQRFDPEVILTVQRVRPFEVKLGELAAGL